MSANERRAEIIRILEGRRQDTCKNLAFQLHVTERTIRSDIIALGTDYRIYATPGNGGGVRLETGYREFMGTIPDWQQNAFLDFLPKADIGIGTALCEALRAQDSYRNKEKIEEAINHSQQQNAHQSAAVRPPARGVRKSAGGF